MPGIDYISQKIDIFIKGAIEMTTRSNFIIFWVLCLHCFYELPSNLKGATLKAVSPSLENVKASISAARPGDTIIVPAGRETWASQLVLTKGITLKGAGIGKTVITSSYRNTSDSFSNSAYLVVYNPSAPENNEPFRLSGFTIDCVGKCRPLLIKNNNNTFINKVRIDHNRILGGFGHYVIQIKGHVFGVADNNILDGCYLSVDFMDDTTWNNHTYEFGTANAFYFEDNTMVGRHDALVLRSEMGAMWCARYNTWDGTNMTTGLYPWLDAHGNGTGHYAVMGVEIYENVLTNTLPGESAIIFVHRGGKALVYNNRANIAAAVGPRVWEEFADSKNPPATNPISGQPQHVSDSYYWGNRRNGTIRIDASVEYTVDYGGSIGIVPRENRDFWKEVSAFNGTTGVGIGLLSARPTTCTEGVGYWATDKKILYKATATNVWTEYYRAYTYPHPLRMQLSDLDDSNYK